MKIKKIIFIGSGPLPLTLIMFNKIFKSKCIGIEMDEKVANLSREVLKKINMEENIEIIVGDEKKQYKISIMTLLWLQLLLNQKKEFLQMFGK